MQWQCWGPEAQYIDWGGEDNHVASAVIDRVTAVVYCLELFTGEACLRYLEPEFEQDFRQECLTLDIDPDDTGTGDVYVAIDAATVMALLTQLNPGELPNDPT